jgi:hypothetical protein
LGTSPTITTPVISSLSSASATNLTLQSAGTTAMTIDTSQNVGIGTAGPTAKLDISNGGIKVSTGGYNLTMQGSASSGTLNGLFIAGVPRVTDDTGTFENTYIGCGASVGNIIFQQGSSSTTSSNTERMRIDSSGNLLISGTSATGTPAQGVQVLINGGETNVEIGHKNGTASGTEYVGFSYNSSKIGSITQNGTTGVLYNLTSDYRLKNNPVALTGAKDFVMALQPKKWQWWDGSGEGVGFIAHEFMAVAKYSGNGTKDAVETIEIKDEQGNVTGTEQRPIMQSIQPSSSEVMANMVALMQEQQATITALTVRIVALENA